MFCLLTKLKEKIQEENIYHVKTTVSNHKNEDFTKTAEKYKDKTMTSNNK